MMNGNGYRPFKITFLDINFYPFRKRLWEKSYKTDNTMCVWLVALCGEEEDNFVYVLVSWFISSLCVKCLGSVPGAGGKLRHCHGKHWQEATQHKINVPQACLMVSVSPGLHYHDPQQGWLSVPSLSKSVFIPPKESLLHRKMLLYVQ